MSETSYRGRLAPSPTGLLHVGHARTFWAAYQRARATSGTLVMRNDDLDPHRSREEFVAAMLEDLRWLDIEWQEGLMSAERETGAFGPYSQSARMPLYGAAFRALLEGGFLYPCRCSRRELQAVAGAPHEADGAEGAMYPGTCRRVLSTHEIADALEEMQRTGAPPETTWRFRLPDGEAVSFTDGNPRLGEQQFVTDNDFGDFAVWRRDGVPAYQLACVVDDAHMRITEVVRGADLLLSTARQLLLQRALRLPALDYFHCELVMDSNGNRLAKRADSLSIHALRERELTPAEVLALSPA